MSQKQTEAQAITRRRFLQGAGAITAGLVAGGVSGCSSSADPADEVLVPQEVSCLPEAFEGADEGTRPNVILIMADDLGYGDLGSYGQEQILTPHLDQFAAEGMRFTQSYAGSTVCAPSRCSLLTGLHTGHARIRANVAEELPLRPQDFTLSELFQCAGYKTAMFGKWGLSQANDVVGTPERKGFDEWMGYLRHKEAWNYHLDYLWQNGERIELEGNKNGQQETYIPDLLTEKALEFISNNKDTPFFLYLPYTLPHANNKLGEETGNGMEVPTDAPYSDEAWPQVEKDFAAMVTRLDEYVGQLVAHLQAEGIDEETLIIFTSDNGPHAEGGHNPTFFDSGGPLRGKKRDLYEGGIRVPTLARWPDQIEAGSVSEQVWAFWDFLPTFAELLGAEFPVTQLEDGTKLPPELDGISVLPAFFDANQVIERDALYWEYYKAKVFKQGIRLGDWKGIRFDRGPVELYDLKEDIGEQHNVAADHPEVVKQIEAALEKVHVKSPYFPRDKSWMNRFF